jgi:Skp family chaperone for outer membrane proteins
MRRSTKVLVTLATAALLMTMFTAANAQGTIKIGVFDPQRVSEETIEGKRIQARLEALRDKRQNEIATDERAIGEAQQQLTQQALSLSQDKLQQMEIDIQMRLLELNSRKETATRAFQLEIAAEEAKFNEKLRGVIGRFAEGESFAIILEVGAVAYAAPTVDVTTGIIDAFNQAHPATAE